MLWLNSWLLNLCPFISTLQMITNSTILQKLLSNSLQIRCTDVDRPHPNITSLNQIHPPVLTTAAHHLWTSDPKLLTCHNFTSDVHLCWAATNIRGSVPCINRHEYLSFCRLNLAGLKDWMTCFSSVLTQAAFSCMITVYSRKGYTMVGKLSVQDFHANIKFYLNFTNAAADQLLQVADSYPS